MSTGSKIGYARSSSADQDLTIQLQQLKDAGCHPIRSEKKSGTTINGRTELQTILDFIRAGDQLCVCRLDRLCRSITDLYKILALLEERGATLHILNVNIDTSTATGKVFLGMLGIFAEFENNLRRERQLDGILAAKKKGVYKGRPVKIDKKKIIELRAQNKSISDIANQMNISRMSVHRALNG